MMSYTNRSDRWVLTMLNRIIIRSELFSQFTISCPQKDMYSTVPRSSLSFGNQYFIFNIFPFWENVTHELIIPLFLNYLVIQLLHIYLKTFSL